MYVRVVDIADAEALRAIYNPEVLETTVTFDLEPRTLEQQEEWIREHQGVRPCLVAVDDEQFVGEKGARGERICGFAVLNYFRERPGYTTTVENSVYIHRQARGRGIAELLMRQLITAAKDCGYHSLIARIVGDNAGSIALHERVGFHLVGREIEVGRKHGKWLDVVEYQYVIPES